jgi:hypothetical protein
MNDFHPEHLLLMDEWRYLYTKTTQKPAPQVTWDYGWFTIHNHNLQKHRKRDFIKTIKELRRRWFEIQNANDAARDVNNGGSDSH